MYELKLEHPRAQPNCTRSYKKESVFKTLTGRRKDATARPWQLVMFTSALIGFYTDRCVRVCSKDNRRKVL